MSTLPARNRVIYQSEALFISPDTTGNHVYFNPSFKSQGNGCLVTGTKNDAQATLNLCDGTVTLSNSATEKWANATMTCYTGNYTGGDDSQTGLSPILDLVGLSGEITGNDAAMLHLERENSENKKINVNDEGSHFGTAVTQLKRVQSANYSFTINRQDVNQFGLLGRIDSVVLEAPTVSLDYSYYLTDGANERLMGMVTDGSVQSLSGIMSRGQNEFGNNYFILTVPEGRDAVKGDVAKDIGESDKTVIGLGNGYITDYSIEASVGSFPTVSVTVDGSNIKSDQGTRGNVIPAVDPQDGSQICNTCFFLPPSESGVGESILKPGDITIDLKNSSLISKQISGDMPGYGTEDKGSAHIQSFTLSTPLGRTDLQRLGNTYAYAKEVDFPVTCTLSVNALVADLKSGSLVDLVCGKEYNMSIKMQQKACVTCGTNEADTAVYIDIKRALLDSESFSSAIGDNKSVDLTFSTQIGGPEDQGVGIFFSGFENSQGTDNKFKRSPDIKPGLSSRQESTSHTYYKPYGTDGTTGGFADDRY